MSGEEHKRKTQFKTTLDLQGMNGLAEAEARQRLDTEGPAEEGRT